MEKNLIRLLYRVMRAAILVLMLLLSLIHPQLVSAAGFGEGTYGSGKYGVGNASATDSLPAPEGCTTTPPSSAPLLYAATAKSSSSIELFFTDAQEPYDHYV